MSTGQESPQSVSVTGYYKGFSIIITVRDPSESVSPLVEKAMNGVDFMMKNEFKPSWNEDTNKSFNKNESWQDEGNAKETICAECGGKAVVRSGVSNKSGKPKKWTGVFCQENKEHVSWGN